MSRTRIDSVVRVRGLQERIARGAVFASRRTAAAQEQRQARSVRFLDALAAASPTDAVAFVGHRRQLDGGVRAVHAAGESVAEAQRVVEGSLDDWKSATQRLEGVERLDERLAAAEQDELDRRVATEIEDLTLMRWNRTRSGNSGERMNGAS